MFFQNLIDPLASLESFQAAERRLIQGKGAWLSGVWGGARAFVAAALVSRLRRPTVIVCVDESSALDLYEELRFFLQGFPALSAPDQVSRFHVKYPTVLDPALDPLVYFPPLESSVLDAVNREQGRSIERLLILRRLAQGEPLVMVVSLPALLQRQVAPEALVGASLSLTRGGQFPMDMLAKRLVALGYRREASVEEPGQFSVRGGILDLAPPDTDHPLRLEFDGDTLESLRAFDPVSQRSFQAQESLEVMPFHELILDDETRDRGLERILEAPMKKEARQRWHDQLRDQPSFGGQDWLLPFFYPETTLFDHLDCLKEKPILIADQPQQWKDVCGALADEAAAVAERRVEQGQLYPSAAQWMMDWSGLEKRMKGFPLLGTSLLPHSLGEFKELEPYPLTFKSLDLNAGDPQLLFNEVLVWMSRGLKLIFAAHSHGELLRIKDMLDEKKLPSRELKDGEAGLADLQEGEIGLTLAKLDKGFLSPGAKFVMVSDQDIFRRTTLKAPRVYRHRYQGLKGARKIESFSELKEGDCAVHLRHGIGIFRGVVRLNIEGHDKDFVCLEYAEKEKLYVPVDQVNLVQKYLGGEDNPRLHKLGGASWAAAQERVKKSVADLAAELLRIYASRELSNAPGTGPDSKWQREFEESFPFDETEDQLKAIEEIKTDLEGRKPMDRLLCGDVGFGKTEVALRAAFKAVMAGQQAAVLVPTTILAQQHYNTFAARLAAFPVRLGLMSRFRSAKEQKQTLAGLKDGSVDLVVGTHRLLSRDVAFKKLGLIIVDEEQRFGVAHKERLKRLRHQVGVLAMSATPVPRTLHFSLAGLRDMSLIETPPLDRLPVRTYVLEDDPAIMREAILAELKRQGQVFFVHNRVKDIEKVAARLRALVPEASVAVGHGQMPKHDLEKVMVEFLGRAHDILVATTIIESGLDIPNVNTILINYAQDFGLSQLYQLRGRVGRSERQAYAYLFYPKARSLPEVAEKRLAAIEEFTELGAGFKVAMRDLEIRGVGNILGPQQHGHVSAVGFDMYCHLLNEAVSKLKGEDIPQEDRTPTLHLDMDAYIPENYIPDPRQKMDCYKRLASIDSRQGLADVEEELQDRYGDPPRQVRALLDAVDIRLWALELGLSEVTQRSNLVVLRYFEDTLPGGAFVREMMLKLKDKIKFLQGPPPGLSVSCSPGQGAQLLRSLLPLLKHYVKIPGLKELAPKG
ncbi:MAG: transcription-repair coupling factor [candidate division FCPU426 bacterium]